MKLVAWDTSSKTGALVALEWNANDCQGWQDVQLVTELTLNVDLTHSERLLWGIHQVLESARWGIQDVDVFGVGIGPGSFTGLRIGLTTARTLAHTLKKPLVRFSSLAALARPVALSQSFWNLKKDSKNSSKSAGSKTVLIASTDACKGELFALWGRPDQILDCVVPEDQLFSAHRSLWNSGVREEVLDPAQLIEEVELLLSQLGKDSYWISVGEGRKRYPDIWAKLPSSRELPEATLFSSQIQGRYAGLLAFEAIQAGLLCEGLEVNPKYLRSADAEIKLKAGLLPPGPYRGLRTVKN